MRPRSGRWVEAYRLCLLETLRCLPQETWARAHQPRAEHAYERQPRHDRALLTRAGGVHERPPILVRHNGQRDGIAKSDIVGRMAYAHNL